MTLAIDNFQLLGLDNAPFGGQQLDIEHPAHLGRAQLGRRHHIGLEPHGLAQEITRVVEVQIDLLLHVVSAEVVIRLDQPGHRCQHTVGESRLCRNRQGRNNK